MLLLATSTLGFLLAGNPELEQRILDSALSQFPVIGDQLTGPEGLTGSSVAVIIGSLGALYGALGVVQAAQNAMNIAWAVPRNKRPDPFMSRLRSALLLVTAGLAILATTALAAFGSSRASMGGALGRRARRASPSCWRSRSTPRSSRSRSDCSRSRTSPPATCCPAP